MIRTALAAPILFGALLLAVPAAAQNQQEALNARYDRALAAGYKALMLCGAIASAEANGAVRTPESVLQWELAGIQTPQDAIIGGLPYEILRNPGGTVGWVEVRWSNDMPPRIAATMPQGGCAILPIGQQKPETIICTADCDRVPTPFLPPRFDPVVVTAPAATSDGMASGVEAAFATQYGEGRTTAVLIAMRGQIVMEKYAPGFDKKTPQRTFSVAKSIAATLIGAAVYRGEVDVNASAGLGLADNDPRRAITIDHLLRMASGRYSDTPGNRTDPLYYGGATVDEVALDWPLVSPPGTSYRYANNDTLAAVAAIKDTFAAHPPAELFAKLGMAGTVAETDWQGDYILSSQVWATADDLAKLGQLYLNDGVFPSGERILPEGWVKYVTTPSGPQPLTGTFGYGAGFWLLDKEEGVPPDTFAAIGNRGQFVVIVPSRKVVIVRRGEDPAGSGFDIAGFTRDVLAALAGE